MIEIYIAVIPTVWLIIGIGVTSLFRGAVSKRKHIPKVVSTILWPLVVFCAACGLFDDDY